jgi:hypothetical protein
MGLTPPLDISLVASLAVSLFATHFFATDVANQYSTFYRLLNNFDPFCMRNLPMHKHINV